MSVRPVVAVVGALLLAACTGTGGEPAGSSNPETATSSPNDEVSAFGDLPPCEDDASWLCGSVSVPLDRAEPDGEQLEIAFYVQPHSDASTPAAEPVFVTPGGPGRNVWIDGKDPIASIASLTANHDIVAVATRGTGASGAIDCADFQSGFSSLRELRSDTTACGAQLGDDADRYGGGDVAMDVDAVREALGFETIDYYGFSYATVDAQAYAARFPERLHAVVLDSGLPVSDEELAFFWGLGVPETLVRVPALYCELDLACSAEFPKAEADLRRMIEAIGQHPLEGTDADAAGIPADLVVDQTAVAYLLGSIPYLSPTDLLEAASALENRNPAPLLRLVHRFPPFIPDGDGLPTDFSSGDSAARSCNDQDAVWNRSDPPAAREHALAAELDALPANAFAPFTKQTWNDYWWLDMCLGWPAPDRFEPAVPEGAVFDGIPALILAGDLDTVVSTETSRALLEGFPEATFLLVRGAGHITIGSDTCAGEIVTTFFDTLDAGDTTCAGPQPQFER
jgi:pimeloyl-ACP methyl ester carboxylesterase